METTMTIEETLDEISVGLTEMREKLYLIRELGEEDEELAVALSIVAEAESIVDTHITNR
jgi:hypothetical protein